MVQHYTIYLQYTFIALFICIVLRQLPSLWIDLEVFCNSILYFSVIALKNVAPLSVPFRYFPPNFLISKHYPLHSIIHMDYPLHEGLQQCPHSHICGHSTYAQDCILRLAIFFYRTADVNKKSFKFYWMLVRAPSTCLSKLVNFVGKVHLTSTEYGEIELQFDFFKYFGFT